MQEYYAMKLKCVLLRLMIGFFLIITGICIAGTIIQEILGSYLASSYNAYIAGLVITFLMFAAGIIIIYMSLSFERFVFANKGKDFDLLKSDMESVSAVSDKNIILTDHFLLAFNPGALNACSVIKTENITAVFQNPAWDKRREDEDYIITVYDNHFRKYNLCLRGGHALDGHDMLLKLFSDKPWIITYSEDEFLEKISMGAGRRQILRKIKAHKEEASQKSSDQGDHITD